MAGPDLVGDLSLALCDALAASADAEALRSSVQAGRKSAEVADWCRVALWTLASRLAAASYRPSKRRAVRGRRAKRHWTRGAHTDPTAGGSM